MKSKQEKPSQEEPEKVETKIYMDKRLRDIAAAECKSRGVSFTDVVAELVAVHFGVPELAIVPRKVVGRKLGTKMKKKK